MNLFDPVVTPLVKPKPPSATSIPAILKSLQDEWVCSYTVLYVTCIICYMYYMLHDICYMYYMLHVLYVTCIICYMYYISGVAKNERG